MTVLSLPTALRDMRRYLEILSVLIKHGFGDLVHELKLESVLEKGFSLVGQAKSPALEDLPRRVRVRKVLEELGTTFIKLGQVLSTRPDLVPGDWADEFRLLQNRCPAVPFPEIRKRLKQQFPKKFRKVFRAIDAEPVAAASIAQVHRAVLENGTPVLLKVLRPGIEDRVEADIAILHTLARLTEEHFSNLGYRPAELVNEFSKTIHREMDFLHEAEATEHLRAIFEGDQGIYFPKIYREATTHKILAEEEIKGTLLADPKARRLSLQNRRALVENGTRAVLCQCLEAGYFHADPHPANIFALPHGKIAFIDCGMIGRLDDATMHQLAELVAGIVGGDVERVTAVVATLTEAGPEKTSHPSFRADIRGIISHFENTTLGGINIASVLQEFFAVLRANGLHCPADLVLLIKALATIESVGKDLEPSFDFVNYAAPFVQKLVDRQYSASAIRARLQKSLVAYAELAETLPSDLRQVLKQLRGNKVTVNLEHRGLTRLTSTIEHASRNISFSLIIAAVLVGSSILVLSESSRGGRGVSTLGLLGFGAACALLIVRIIFNRRYRG